MSAVWLALVGIVADAFRDPGIVIRIGERRRGGQDRNARGGEDQGGQEMLHGLLLSVEPAPTGQGDGAAAVAFPGWAKLPPK